MLSVGAKSGLWDLACETASVASAALTLIPGRLSLVPLAEPIALESLGPHQIGALQRSLRALRRECDLVLVDAGPWESLVPPLIFECRAVDAILAVGRCDDPHHEPLDEESGRLPGVEWLGTIETFAPASRTNPIPAR